MAPTKKVLMRVHMAFVCGRVSEHQTHWKNALGWYQSGGGHPVDVPPVPNAAGSLRLS